MALQTLNFFDLSLIQTSINQEIVGTIDEANTTLTTAQQLLQETEAENLQLTQAANSALDQEDALQRANRQELETVQSLIALVSRAVAAKRERVEKLSALQARTIEEATALRSQLTEEARGVYEQQFNAKKAAIEATVTTARHTIGAAEVREKARLQAIFNSNQPVTQQTPHNLIQGTSLPAADSIPLYTPPVPMASKVVTLMVGYAEKTATLPQVEAAALQQITLRV